MRSLMAALCVVVSCVACGQSPTAPSVPVTTPVLTHEIDYDINIPERGMAHLLQTQYPHGVYAAPITAQLTWNYTKEYGGSANAYYGPLAGENGQYNLAGVCIAPTNVARVDTFLGSSWPGIGLEPNTTYTWVGHFVFTLPTQLGDPANNPPVFGPPMPPHAR